MNESLASDGNKCGVPLKLMVPQIDSWKRRHQAGNGGKF